MSPKSFRSLRKPSEYDTKQVSGEILFSTQRLYNVPNPGLSDEEELHQYVLYDTEDQKKGPRRINLDDEPKNKYAPPKNLTVHLSKISMPELQPKGHTKDKPSKDMKKKEDKQGWW